MRKMVILGGLLWLLTLSFSGIAAQSACTLAPDQAWLAWSMEYGDYFEIYVSDGTCQVTILSESETSASPARLIWSADKQLAWISGLSGNLDVYRWDGQSVTNVSQSPDDEHDPAWSPDGRLAWGVGRDDESWIVVWDENGIVELTPGLSEYAEPRWSPEGRLAWMSSVAEELEVQMWDGENVVNLSQHEGYDLHPVWLDAERLIWVSNREGEDHIYVWDGSDSLTNISGEQGGSRDYVGAADGRIAWAAYSGKNTVVYVWQDGQVTEVAETVLASNLYWTTDGRLGWTMGFSTLGTAYLWDGETVTTVADHTAVGTNWSSQGWLAWHLSLSVGMGWEIHVWDGQSDRLVGEVEGDVRSHAWSDDNRLAWVGRADRTQIYVWDGIETRLLMDVDGFPSDIAWSPTGA